MLAAFFLSFFLLCFSATTTSALPLPRRIRTGNAAATRPSINHHGLNTGARHSFARRNIAPSHHYDLAFNPRYHSQPATQRQVHPYAHQQRQVTRRDLPMGNMQNEAMQFERRSKPQPTMQFTKRSPVLSFVKRSPGLSFTLKPRSESSEAAIPARQVKAYHAKLQHDISCDAPSNSTTSTDQPSSLNPLYDDALLAVDLLRYTDESKIAGDGCIYLSSHATATITVCGNLAENGITYDKVWTWATRVLEQCSTRAPLAAGLDSAIAETPLLGSLPEPVSHKHSLTKRGSIVAREPTPEPMHFTRLETNPSASKHIGRRAVSVSSSSRGDEAEWDAATERDAPRVGGVYKDGETGVRVEIAHT